MCHLWNIKIVHPPSSVNEANELGLFIVGIVIKAWLNVTSSKHPGIFIPQRLQHFSSKPNQGAIDSCLSLAVSCPLGSSVWISFQKIKDAPDDRFRAKPVTYTKYLPSSSCSPCSEAPFQDKLLWFCCEKGCWSPLIFKQDYPGGL